MGDSVLTIGRWFGFVVYPIRNSMRRGNGLP
jgi:hypothetical protein